MGVYLTILFFLFSFSILNLYIRKDISGITKIFFAEFAVLCLLGGLRENIGMDYQSYKDMYSLSYKLNEMNEGGFIWLVYFFNFLGLPFSFFCFFFSFFTVLLAFRFVCKRSPYIFFSILLYFSLGNYYFASFNAIRQALATVIFLNILELIEKRKFLLYTLILLLTAYFVHGTVLILIPLYFFLRKDWHLYVKIALLVFTILFSSVILVIIENSPYASYLRFEVFATKVPPTYYLMALMSLFLAFYSLRHSCWKKKNYLLLNLNFIMILLLCLIFIYEDTPIVMVINRLLGYFSMIYIVILPILYNEMKLISNRCLFIVLTSCLFAFLSYKSLYQNGEANKIVPYETIFGKYK